MTQIELLRKISETRKNLSELQEIFLIEDGWVCKDDLWYKGDCKMLTDDEAIFTYTED